MSGKETVGALAKVALEDVSLWQLKDLLPHCETIDPAIAIEGRAKAGCPPFICQFLARRKCAQAERVLTMSC